MAAMVAMWLRNPRHAVTWATLPFVAAHVLVAHKEARFLFPLAILATAFPVLGFSPRLPRWRDTFARIWSGAQPGRRKRVTALSLSVMAYLAVYPFGVRPHMPMAQYLYRHRPGAVASLTPVFPVLSDVPAGRIIGPQQLHAGATGRRAGQRPGAVDVANADPAAGHPRQSHAALFGISACAPRLCPGGHGLSSPATRRLRPRARFLKLLPLYWYTLYRLERSATIRS